ncbi:restriction endonuclease [Kordia sp. YSTF-M3]|uniref:Restriction endonuclease n=1 Tax=Kordia aestuariivivens TaxID=2759037 RepID=A0ABR7QFG3_9FLAO|nr:restriction endonuclease [Kordia aestuariivivens]MBC8757302.1 restriction endonuclease [Kordia aestuariivivens]
MTKKSDEFEKQVARIYSILESDKESIVTWDEEVPNPHYKGTTRQVDITVRKGNSLTVIECRMRNRTQGSEWVDQLDGKRNSLGADKVIGVSASGFTKPAIAQAEALGVFLRDLSSITEKEVQSWANKSEIRICLYKYEDIKFAFFLKKEKGKNINKKDIRIFMKENEYLQSTFKNIKHFLQEDKFSSVDGEEVALESNPLPPKNIIKGIHIEKIQFCSNISVSSKDYDVNSIMVFSNLEKPNVKEEVLHIEKHGLGNNEIIKKGEFVTPIIDLTGFKLEPNNQFNGRFIVLFGTNYKLKTIMHHTINGDNLNKIIIENYNIDIVWV